MSTKIISALIAVVDGAVFPHLNRRGAAQVTEVLSVAERFIAEAKTTPASDSEEIEVEVELNE